MVVGESFPRGFWLLDESGTHSDYSGYGRDATSASSTFGPSLVNGASRSLITSNASKVTYSAPVLVRTKEHLPFSIEAHAAPVFSSTTISEQQIFGRSGAMDGLTINGTVVSFVTKYSSTGEARASFDLGQYRAVYAVGVHTQTSNYLFIDGDLVAEVEISEAQQKDTFISTSPNLSSGESSSSNSLMLNAIGAYEGILEHSAILIHYGYGRAYVNPEHLSIGYGGELLEFSSAQTSPIIEEDYSLESDWNMGGLFSAVVTEDSIYPEVENGLTMDASWEIVIPLDSDGSMYAGTVRWEGQGLIVETSRDGNTWIVAENGVNVANITSGASSTDEVLYIRVKFLPGLNEGESFLDRLIFTLHSTSSVPEVGGREVILSKASIEDNHEIKKYHENWGLELRDGSLTIKALVDEEPVNPKTIEVWVRKGITGSMSDNLYTPANRWRSNGTTGQTYRTGEWQLRHYVFDSGFSGDIVFSGTGQIGHVILYPEALTNDDIKSIYDSYMGAPSLSVPNPDVVDIFEFNDQVDISEYDWAIEASG